jgi:hypothetical protein
MTDTLQEPHISDALDSAKSKKGNPNWLHSRRAKVVAALLVGFLIGKTHGHQDRFKTQGEVTSELAKQIVHDFEALSPRQAFRLHFLAPRTYEASDVHQGSGILGVILDPEGQETRATELETTVGSSCLRGTAYDVDTSDASARAEVLSYRDFGENEGYIEVVPANPSFPILEIKDTDLPDWPTALTPETAAVLDANECAYYLADDVLPQEGAERLGELPNTELQPFITVAPPQYTA